MNTDYRALLDELDLDKLDRLIDQLYEARALMVDAARSAGVDVPSTKVTDEQAAVIARAALDGDAPTLDLAKLHAERAAEGEDGGPATEALKLIEGA